MKLRLPLSFAAMLGAILLAWVPGAFAHSPFDCSARIFLHADSAEVAVMVGTSLGENFLATAQIKPVQLPNGHPYPLNAAMVTNFFEVADDAKILQPRAADVITDGLEYQFRFEFPLASAKSLRLKANFLPLLRAPRAAALVMTDENGNILGSAMLSPEKTGAEFALPAPSPALRAPAPPVEVRGPSDNLLTGTIAGTLAETKTSPSFGEFFKLGMEHILTGYDHLLFLLALLLGCRRLKTMLWVVTGFTLVHSLTLALAALDWATISTRIVEPAIAASIIFVAAENFRRTEKSWQRYALTCGFGLIHGFGFAGALRASGLGGHGVEIVKPLLAFNLGVETGQLLAVAAVLPLLLALGRWPWFGRNGVRLISALVILVAAFWLWQRVR